jgi:hypothetical protein
MAGAGDRMAGRQGVPWLMRAALNRLISAGDMTDNGRAITGRPVTIALAYAA